MSNVHAEAPSIRTWRGGLFAEFHSQPRKFMKEAKSGWLLKTHFSVFRALRFCTQEMSVGKRRESTNDRVPDSKLQLSIVTERQTRHQMFHRSWPPWVAALSTLSYFCLWKPFCCRPVLSAHESEWHGNALSSWGRQLWGQLWVWLPRWLCCHALCS